MPNSTAYSSLRRLIALVLQLYFVEIQSTGAERVPRDGAIIFAANHPSSIMDTALLGTQVPRQIHYLARSGLFDNPLVARVLDACGAIPIYRAQDGGGDNRAMFARAFEVLQRGDCLGIFPEGQNSGERHLLPIKTGAARIALGALDGDEALDEVWVVPVGINFEDRDQFLSSVLLRFGEPIPASRWRTQHAEAPVEAARGLTDAIERGLHEVAVHITDAQIERAAEALMAMAGMRLLGALTTREGVGGLLPAQIPEDAASIRAFLMGELRATSDRRVELDESLQIKQLIADVVAHHQAHHPEIFQQARRALLRYEDHLRQLNLRRDFWERHPSTMSSRIDAARLTLYAVIFGPLAGWGIMLNLLPYHLTRALALRAPEEAIRAFTALVAGGLLFPLYYAALAYGTWSVSGHQWAPPAALVASGVIGGFFSFRYRRVVARYRARILARTLFRTQRHLIKWLLRERAMILAALREAVARYAASRAEYLEDAPAS